MTDRKIDKRKEKFIVKTFLVPFTLEEFKEDITFTTNNVNQLSKEQIINEAFKLHSQGNLPEAVKHYQFFINQGFTDHRVFSNYGKILKDQNKLTESKIILRKAITLRPDYEIAYSNLGDTLRDLNQLKEAEICTRKAIDINPSFAEAHSNLGLILKDLGNKKEAEISINRAIELNPSFAEAYCNLGVVLNELGRSEDAEICTRKAIKFKTNFTAAYCNLANILSDLGKSRQALDAYLKAIEIEQDNTTIHSSLALFLKHTEPNKLDKSKLKIILNLLLQKNHIHHQVLFKSINFLYTDEIKNILDKLNLGYFETEIPRLLINEKIIIDALKKIIFSDLKMENLLAKMREKICNKIAYEEVTFNHSEIEFIISLGVQCFLNEYIYSISDAEKIAIDKIINRCKLGQLNEKNILIIACYYPLYKILERIPSLETFNSSNQGIKELIKIQISEPLKENDLSNNIKKLGHIEDNTSLLVKSQYEENPYPRWRYGQTSKKQKFTLYEAINSEIRPNLIDHDLISDQLKILIAGCGTGYQLIQADRYNNAEITGIDLSLTSLSYAQRKINELGIKNINLIQMDILEVALLKVKYDIIECCGVLHHLDDPIKGLKALLDVLKPNGFMKISLYSELSRQSIVKAREFIKKKNLKPNINCIRSFREDIIAGKYPEIFSLTDSGNDFYNTSNLRDLCFHYQEHRFTFNQLEEILNIHELQFHGFFLSQRIKSLYKDNFPDDKKQVNLKNWGKLERKYPGIFGETPPFWVSKINK